MHQTLFCLYQFHDIGIPPYPPSSQWFLTMWYRIPPIPHLLIGYTFLYTSLSDLSKIILLVTKLDTLFRILVLAIMKLSNQELSIALEEFERTMVDVSELFLPLLENRLDRTTICAAVESGAMRFAMFVWSLLQARTFVWNTLDV